MKNLILVIALVLPLCAFSQEFEEPIILENTEFVSLPVGADTVNVEAPMDPPPVDAAQEPEERPEESFAGADNFEEKIDAPSPESFSTVDTPIVTAEDIKAQDVAAAEASMPVMTTEVPHEERNFRPRQSHWLTTFGFEGMEYKLPWQYDGVKEDFDGETRALYGGRIGVGREFYLGKSIFTSTRVEGYYMGTLFESAKTADPTLPDEEAAITKDAGSFYGVDAVQTLSFIFEMKTKNPFMDEWTYLYVEPFIEAGIGKARAYNARKYKYDTGPAGFQEEYNHRLEDDITNTKIGAGINFTSRQGFMLYLRVTQNRYDISERKSRGYFYRDGESPSSPHSLKETFKNADIDPITVYAIGGGYKF